MIDTRQVQKPNNLSGTDEGFANGDNVPKPIEHVIASDRVVSADRSGQLEPGAVEKTFAGTSSELMNLSFADDHETVVTAPGHRFLTEAVESVGTKHMIQLGGNTAQVVDVHGSVVEATGGAVVYADATGYSLTKSTTSPIAFEDNAFLKQDVESGWTTYNFEVSEHHNYVAEGIRVHNDSILATLDEGDVLIGLNDDLTEAAVLRDVDNDGDLDVVVLEGFARTDSSGERVGTDIAFMNIYENTDGNLGDAVLDVLDRSYAATAPSNVTNPSPGGDPWNNLGIADDIEEVLFDDVLGLGGDGNLSRPEIRSL